MILLPPPSFLWLMDSSPGLILTEATRPIPSLELAGSLPRELQGWENLERIKRELGRLSLTHPGDPVPPVGQFLI